MYSPTKQSISQQPINRSASVHVIGHHSANPTTTPQLRHSSSNVFDSPTTLKRTTSTTTTSSTMAFEVSPEMLLSTRRSMDSKSVDAMRGNTLRGSAEVRMNSRDIRHSPMQQSRALPPLPSPGRAPASSPMLAAMPKLPSLQLSPPLPPRPSSEPNPLSPKLISPKQKTLPPLPPVPQAQEHATAPSSPLPPLRSPSFSPLSKRPPPPLPPRAVTSPDLSSSPLPFSLDGGTIQNVRTESPRLKPSKPNCPPPLPPRALTNPNLTQPLVADEHEETQHNEQEAKKRFSTFEPAVRVKEGGGVQKHFLARYKEEQHEQEARKDARYLSNPEPAVAMKDGGVVQRHLSAPSSMLDELHLKNSGQIENQDSAQYVQTRTESPSLRSSAELSSESSTPTLRAWKLKSQQIVKKERAEFRIHRRTLPDIVEVTLRNKVIKEIISTEAQYVDDLFVLMKVFKEPIQRYNTIADADTNAIFSNVEDLYQANKALLRDLVGLIAQINAHPNDDEHIPPIPSAFLRHLDKFSGYTVYLCNKELSMRVVQKVDNMAHFSSLMSLCREHPDACSLNLGDYLIKPLQRLCKYPLLLKELRKQLLPDDPQLLVLNQVVEEVERLTEITNRTISNTEKLNQIKAAMGDAVAPLVEGATVVRDGVLCVVAKSKKEEASFWLLDKCILWHPQRGTIRAKVVKGKSRPKNAVNIHSITSVCEKDHEHHKHSFSLRFANDEGKEKVAVFCAPSYLEKLCWIEDIKLQVDKK